MSNKANIKFAKFTANKPPLYKYNRTVASGAAKKGYAKDMRGILVADLIKNSKNSNIDNETSAVDEKLS